MPKYKCSACDHIFLHNGKKRPVCPQCYSLFAEEVEEIENDFLAFNKVSSKPYSTPSPQDWINKLEPNEINDMAREIDEQIKSAVGFSPEDRSNIRDDILKKWKANIQQQIEQADDYTKTVNSLNPRLKKIVATLESIASKLPIEWDEFLSRKLQATPSYFRNLERTRKKIFEEWKENLTQFDREFDKEWEGTISGLSEIDATHPS